MDSWEGTIVNRKEFRNGYIDPTAKVLYILHHISDMDSFEKQEKIKKYCKKELQLITNSLKGED